jgi:predicted DNA-binding transcriptional regulator AlpA
MPTTRGKATMGLNEVAALMGCERHSISRWVKLGTFPAPFKPGRKKLFWHCSVIERYLLERGAATGKT